MKDIVLPVNSRHEVTLNALSSDVIGDDIAIKMYSLIHFQHLVAASRCVLGVNALRRLATVLWL